MMFCRLSALFFLSHWFGGGGGGESEGNEETGGVGVIECLVARHHL